MIQLNFRASTPAEALRLEPTRVGYSQHEGAESAGWGDAKLKLVDGTHPVSMPLWARTRTTTRLPFTSVAAPLRASAATTPSGPRSTSTRGCP